MLDALGVAVVVGASRGLGLALTTALGSLQLYQRLVLVAREPGSADLGDWVVGDVSDAGTIAGLQAAVGSDPVSCLVYNVGIWEQSGFDAATDAEVAHVVDVSLTGAVVVAHTLLSSVRAGAGHVILIGSTCGLENEGSSAVAYAAAKFGLRGVAHALRELLRPDGVRVTVINLGSTATDVPLGDVPEALSRYGGARIPVDDIVQVVTTILSLSAATCVKEIDMPATLDQDA
jgi:short-subunit dehydrogenase